MRRGTSMGPEIKQAETTLGSLAFISNSTIYVEFGIPKGINEFLI